MLAAELSFLAWAFLARALGHSSVVFPPAVSEARPLVLALAQAVSEAKPLGLPLKKKEPG